MSPVLISSGAGVGWQLGVGSVRRRLDGVYCCINHLTYIYDKVSSVFKCVRRSSAVISPIYPTLSLPSTLSVMVSNALLEIASVRSGRHHRWRKFAEKWRFQRRIKTGKVDRWQSQQRKFVRFTWSRIIPFFPAGLPRRNYHRRLINVFFGFSGPRNMLALLRATRGIEFKKWKPHVARRAVQMPGANWPCQNKYADYFNGGSNSPAGSSTVGIWSSLC